MIRRVYASDKRFKSVDFTNGLNIVIAEQSINADDKDTRNGVGKTTLIHVIDFCLGADLDDKKLPIEEIASWIFYLEMELSGSIITVGRAISDSNRILIEGDTSQLPISPTQEIGMQYYSNDDWKRLLGQEFFLIPKTERKKYKPSYRKLVGFFMRKNKDAYVDPFRLFSKEPTYQMQINNAYLLGLSWENASDVQLLKDKKKENDALSKLLKDSGVDASVASLENRSAVLKGQIERKEKEISQFRVHEEYSKVQKDADELTLLMKNASKESYSLNNKLTGYKEAIAEENISEKWSVSDVYKDIGINFEGKAKKTLDEAKDFHEKLISNRQEFLKTEIEEIENKIKSNRENHKEWDVKRSELLKTLSTYGALEDYHRLQKSFENIRIEFLDVKKMIEKSRKVQAQKQKLKGEKNELETKIERDFQERKVEWESAFQIFDANSHYLYNESGHLTVPRSGNGYGFNIDIPASGSEGISNMKIFCYDLMLLEIFRKKGGINFLVHDSTLFDSVDARQVVKALELAHKKCTSFNGQYICVFNSDMLNRCKFADTFNPNEFIRLKLGDKNDEDSLLGFRYN